MVRERQAEEVPRWVRDFITQRQSQLLEEEYQHQHSLEDAREQVSEDTYLLNPFSQDEVETIRDGVLKLREEAAIAEAREYRRLREAGAKRPPPEFPSHDALFEFSFRQLLHTLLTRQEMQKAVVKHYGWEKWSEDPWGHFPKFCKWMNGIRDDERDVWAINETFGGRVYFTYWILGRLSQIDYSKITDEDICHWIGAGALTFLLVKSYAGWDYFQYHYPDEPLPARFVNEQIIKDYLTCPFSAYRLFINSIYLWGFAFKEFWERAKEHPELEGFLDYQAVTDTQIAEISRKLAPKGYQPPDENQAWGKLYQELKGRLEAKERKYGDVLERGDASTRESLLEGVNYWKSKASGVVIAGLKGRLTNSLLSIVEHDFSDAAGKAYRKHEVTDSKIESTRITDDDTPFFDTIPSPEPTPEELMLLKEPIDLKSLVLNIDDLKPVELLLLTEFCDAKNKDIPLTKYWGKDYTSKIKRFNRLRPKLKKP